MQNAQKKQYVASSCKLKLTGFLTSLRIQDRTKYGRGTELHGEGGRTPNRKKYSGFLNHNILDSFSHLAGILVIDLDLNPQQLT